MILIQKMETGFFRTKILIKSTQYNYENYDSLVGERTFFMEEGERMWLKVSKSFPYFSGEELEFKNLTRYCSPWKFSWKWKY